MTMPVSFLIRPQDQEEVPGQEADDHHADDMPAPEPEVQRTPISDRSPPSPPHTTSTAAPTDTPGLLIQHTIHQSIHMSARGR